MTESISLTTTDEPYCQPARSVSDNDNPPSIAALSSTRVTTDIGSIGCAIDERLNDLRAKLKLLEQANPLQTIEPLQLPLPSPSPSPTPAPIAAPKYVQPQLQTQLP